MSIRPDKFIFSKRPSAGFSLLEILIVIVVAGILAAMLMVGARRAMDRAADAKCLNNLRMLGQGALSYIGDRDGRLFSSDLWYNSITNSNNPGMAEYVGLPIPPVANQGYFDTILTCPSVKRQYPVKFPRFLNQTYTMNYFAMEKRPNDGVLLRPGRVTVIQNPSKMWLFSDCYSDPLIPGAQTTFRRDATHPIEERLLAPHASKRNTVFFDGHVEAVEPEWFKQAANSPFWGSIP